MAPHNQDTLCHRLAIQYHSPVTLLLSLATMRLSLATRFHSPRRTRCHPTL